MNVVALRSPAVARPREPRVQRSAASRLLAELAGGTAVPGVELARRLGVSRAAIWKQVAVLRGLGLPVAAHPGRGYRLDAPLEMLDADRIRSAAAADLPARIEVHWQLDSTSSELLRRAASDDGAVLVCLAEVQTSGRGRRGRAWQTPLGGGIAMSVLRRFDRGMAALSGLSLVVGLATAQALAQCGVDGVGLKWPNDLVARDHKLAGILVELGGDALGPCHAVIGIGINVRLDDDALRAIDQPAIDVASLSEPAAASRNLIVACVLEHLLTALDRFQSSGFAAFAQSYASRDALRDRAVSVSNGGHARSGVARGVDARGALRVEFADGVASVDSGEVSVRARG